MPVRRPALLRPERRSITPRFRNLPQEESAALVACACQGLYLAFLGTLALSGAEMHFAGVSFTLLPLAALVLLAGAVGAAHVACCCVYANPSVPRGAGFMAVLGVFLPATMASLARYDEAIWRSLVVCGLAFLAASVAGWLSGLAFRGLPGKLPLLAAALILAWAFGPAEPWADGGCLTVMGLAVVASGALAGGIDGLSGYGRLHEAVGSVFALAIRVAYGTALITYRFVMAVRDGRQAANAFNEAMKLDEEARERARDYQDME
ncbi:MAG: hypothetical protein LBT40_04555 [Deltaproteobacteria bacterium]|jgi:hypothetical protein|nr:hypothetical protein [Deltaproteobacteria bacterium]